MNRVVCVAWLVLASSGCFFWGGTFGGKKSKPEDRLRPAEVVAQPRAGAAQAMRVLHLKVLADPAYQTAVPHWQGRFQNLVARANKVVGPMLDLRIEVSSMSTWRRATTSEERGALLDDLRQQDAGDVMMFVVGLAPSLPIAATAFDELGAAELGGRHMFVRNLDNLEEHAALERNWGQLSKEERDDIYIARKHHRELIVFLHELGHLFGADHQEDRESIMHDSYWPKQNGYSASSLEVMRAAVLAELDDARRGPDPAAGNAALAQSRSTATMAIERARGAANPEEAANHLQDAELALASYSAGVEDLWLTVAQHYRALSFITLAEQAVVRAGGSPELERWISIMRTRYAMPADAIALGLTPANEPAYVASYTGVLKAIGEDRLRDARRLALAARKRHGDLPGFDVLLCDVSLREAHIKPAARHCERALARCETASWAHFLAGQLALRGTDAPRAKTHFERAVALDPDLVAAHHALRNLSR